MATKFARDREHLARAAVFIDDLCESVKPDASVSVLADEPDNRILECAQTGIADLIVTGDKARLALEEYRGVEILSLRKYLDQMSEV